MSEQATKVLEAARELSAEDRRWVADQLAEELDADDGLPDDDPVLESLVAERIADRLANPQDELPAAEAIAAIQVELDRRRECRSR